MNEQATILPFLAYMKNVDGIVVPTSMCVISDHLQHDSVAVHAFLYPIIDHIKEINSKIKKIKYFTDGAASQYKNKKNFANICCHFDDFGLLAEWHFFASCHGKSACDGIGGTIKRLARLYSLQRTSSNHLSTPKELYDWANGNIEGIKCFYVDKETVAQRARKIKPRMDLALPVKGTRGMHCFIPVNSHQINASPLSLECDFKMFDVLPDPAPFDYASCKEGDIIACVQPNNEFWHLAEVTLTNPEENLYVVKFYTPHGEAGFLKGYQQSNREAVIDCNDVIFHVTSLSKTTVRSRLFKIQRTEYDVICNQHNRLLQGP